MNHLLGTSLSGVARRVLRHNLEEIYLAAAPRAPDRPTIYVSNHQAYWDGFAAMLVTHHRGQELRLQVSSVVTRDFPILQRIGVRPIDETDPMSVLKALKDDARFLAAAPERALWMFAQGRYHRDEAASRYFRGGVSHLVKRVPDAALVPVALRYEILRTRKPVLYLDVGDDVATKVRGMSRRAFVAEIEAVHAELWGEQDRTLRHGGGRYVGLLHNSKGSHACGRFLYTADVRRQVRGMKALGVAQVRRQPVGFCIDIGRSAVASREVLDFLVDRYSLEDVPRHVVESAFTVQRGNA